MYKPNKNVLLIISILTVLLFIVDSIYEYKNESNSTAVNFLFILSTLFWLNLFFNTTNITHSWAGRFFYVGIAINFIGALCKLEHWPNGHNFLLIGCGICAISYGIKKFAIEKNFDLFAIIKVAYVFLFFIGFYSKNMHLPIADILALLKDIVFILLIIIYMARQYLLNKKSLP